jgi:hypothetical protein
VDQIGEAPVVPVFYIWDKAEQKYYSNYELGALDRITWKYAPGPIVYSDKLSKAKKFNRLNDARVHALVKTGYYDDLPVYWGEVPEWMQGSKHFDVPDSWEIVKIDKLTKNVIERIELVDTFKRTWRLRDLTIQFGSAVRAIYSDLDKKKKLDQYTAIMVFTRYENDGEYHWDMELTDSEKEELKDLIDTVDKNDVKLHKSTTGFAFAVKDVGIAAMMKLSYTGKLVAKVIDITTMQEVLENNK